MRHSMCLQAHRNIGNIIYSSSSGTFIDNKESYKQIPCVEHFYMHSNIFRKTYLSSVRNMTFSYRRAP